MTTSKFFQAAALLLALSGCKSPAEEKLIKECMHETLREASTDPRTEEFLRERNMTIAQFEQKVREACALRIKSMTPDVRNSKELHDLAEKYKEDR